jgi:hypothetical protein
MSEQKSETVENAEAKPRCAPAAGSASIVVYVTCSKCKWAGRFSMSPKDPAELERRIATAHCNAKVGWTCDGTLTWTPNA